MQTRPFLMKKPKLCVLMQEEILSAHSFVSVGRSLLKEEKTFYEFNRSKVWRVTNEEIKNDLDGVVGDIMRVRR